MELEGAVGLAVDAALGEGADDAEAYAMRQAGREVRVHDGEVESLTAATEHGIGVRAWIGHRVGFAYGADLSEGGLRDLASEAVSCAQIADEDEHAGAPRADGAYPSLEGLRDPAIAEWPSDRLVELALAVERGATARDERVQAAEQAVYAESDDRMAIRSSTGIDCSFEASSCYAFVYALAEGEGSKETGLGFEIARSPAGLDPEAIGFEGADRAVAMIGAGKPPSRSCPIVFDPTVAASFVGLIGSDRAGNARRPGYRSPPTVGTSNLIVQNGSLATPELLAAAGDGIYVTDVAGLHSGVNPVNGIFSVGASGRSLSRGELADPLREFTIASDLVTMLRSVREAGAEARWVPFGGVVRTPPLLIAEMTVSGS